MSGDGGPPLSSPPESGWDPPTGPPMFAASPTPTAAAGSVGQWTGAPPPGPDDPASGRKVRPWWGMGDVLLMVPVMALVFMASFAAWAGLAVIEGIDFADIGSSSASDQPASIVVIPTLIQQLAWFGWPFIVSKWKGLGPASDWGWAFKPVDLGIGLGTAMMAMLAAGLVATGTGALVGLKDESLAENTQILKDLEGSPWLFGLLFVVVIGAPLSEELLFRGLILRSVQKRWGAVAGVIGSLLIFVPVHLADGGIFGDGQIVLWASIATLGAALAIAAVVTGRLAASIIAHVIINGIASASALGYFDRAVDSIPT